MADETVGYTKFFFVIKKINKQIKTTISLEKWSTSANAPAGKIIIRASNADKVE